MLLTLSTVSSNISLLALAVVVGTGPPIHASNTALLNCKKQWNIHKYQPPKLYYLWEIYERSSVMTNVSCKSKCFGPSIALFICRKSTHEHMCYNMLFCMFKLNYTFGVKGNKHKVTSSLVSRMQEELMYPRRRKGLSASCISSMSFCHGLSIHCHGAYISIGKQQCTRK